MSALAYTLGRYSPETIATTREHRIAVMEHRITKSLRAPDKVKAKGRQNATGIKPFPIGQMGEFHEAWAALQNTRNKLTTPQESDLRAALENHLLGQMSGDVWRKMLNELEAKLREREPLPGTSMRRLPVYEPAPPQGW